MHRTVRRTAARTTVQTSVVTQRVGSNGRIVHCRVSEIEPRDARIARGHGFGGYEQPEPGRAVERGRDEIMRAWREYFGDIGSL
jgi:hypothetical protein